MVGRGGLALLWCCTRPLSMNLIFKVARQLAPWLQRGRGEALVVASARVASAAGALVVAVVSARVLGPAGRGEIVLVVTISILCMGLVDLGTNTSARIRILQGDGTRIEDYLGLSLVLTVVQALMTAGVMLLPKLSGGGLSLETVVVGIALSSAMFLAHMLVDACFAVRLTLHAAARDALAGGIPLVLVLAAAAVGDLSVEGVLWLLTAGYLVGAARLWLVVRRVAGRPVFHVDRWRPLIRSGLPVLGGSFSEAIAYRSDRLVVGVATTAAALGIYSVAATAVELPRLLMIPATQILSNRIASGEVDRVSIKGVCSRLVLAYCVVLGVVGLAGGSLILPLVGDGFDGIHTPLLVMAVGEVFFGVYLIAVAVLMGMARFRRLVLPGVLGALTVVAGGGLVVPEFGIIGAAWVRLAGFGVMAVAAGWATYGELRSRATL